MECIDNAEAPDGWTKWIIPSYEYIVVENHKGAFEETIRKMNEHGISLVGAVHDYTEPTTGKDYLYFPNTYTFNTDLLRCILLYCIK